MNVLPRELSALVVRSSPMQPQQSRGAAALLRQVDASRPRRFATACCYPTRINTTSRADVHRQSTLPLADCRNKSCKMGKPSLSLARYSKKKSKQFAQKSCIGQSADVVFESQIEVTLTGQRQSPLLFRFGLAPEDEARSSRCTAVVPNSATKNLPIIAPQNSSGQTVYVEYV